MSEKLSDAIGFILLADETDTKPHAITRHYSDLRGDRARLSVNVFGELCESRNTRPLRFYKTRAGADKGAQAYNAEADKWNAILTRKRSHVAPAPLYLSDQQIRDKLRELAKADDWLLALAMFVDAR